MEQNVTEAQNVQRVQKKKKGTMGWIAFAALFLSVSVLLFVGIKTVLAYLDHSIGAELIQLATIGAEVAAILAGVAVIISLVTFFFPKQKKGLAVFSLILALIIALLAGAILYFYHYMFSAIDYDSEFDKIEESDLHVVQPDQKGEVIFETRPIEESLPEELVEKQIKMQELEWEYLLDYHLPEEGLAMMNSRTPVKAGYLHPDAAQIENYLLFGLDAVGSSDTVIVLTMDRVHKKVKLTSLARDSYVKIPEWGSYTKLTYAYSAGQAKTAVSTVNYNYMLNVKDYVTVDFEEISQIIELVGGVEVELDYAEINYMNYFGHYGLKKGMNLLDGDAALRYSRMRASSSKDNEAKRTGRQREVLLSMFERAKQIPITDYPELVRRGMDLCKTSFESNEIMGMLVEVVTQGYEIESYALIDMVDFWAGKFGPRNYMYLVYDLDGAADTLYKLIYEDLYTSGYPETTEEAADSTETTAPTQ